MRRNYPIVATLFLLASGCAAPNAELSQQVVRLRERVARLEMRQPLRSKDVVPDRDVQAIKRLVQRTKEQYQTGHADQKMVQRAEALHSRARFLRGELSRVAFVRQLEKHRTETERANAAKKAAGFDTLKDIDTTATDYERRLNYLLLWKIAIVLENREH